MAQDLLKGVVNLSGKRNRFVWQDELECKMDR